MTTIYERTFANKPVFEGPFYNEYRLNYTPRNRSRFGALLRRGSPYYYCKIWHVERVANLILEELRKAEAAEKPAASEPAPEPAETSAPAEPARAAYNPEPIRGFSRHCTEKAEVHAVTTINHGLAAARYEVRSGVSGRTYHVTLTRARASCDCPHGRHAGDGDATCSHVLAVLNHRRGGRPAA